MEFYNLISKINEEKNQLKSAIRYENIKADYFLEKVFNNLEKKKTLNIVKYNKNLKNRINININDYKEYAEKYSSIEIEIKPVSNKYGKFINIKKEEEIYYHIYFNNNKEDISMILRKIHMKQKKMLVQKVKIILKKVKVKLHMKN